MKFKYYILRILFINIQLFYAQTSDMNIATDGSLKTHPDSQIGIFGDLNNDGEFTENGGEVGFYNQDEIQTITGTNAPEISDLIVDIPNDLEIEVNTIVNTGVLFSQGRVVTPRIDPSISLDLLNTDLYVNESDDTHVDGYTSYTGNNAYTFPIGDDFRLRPLGIEINAANNTSNAAYFYEDPNTPTTFNGFNREELDFDVSAVSPVEFWDLDGEDSTRVTLTWDALSSVTNLIDDDNDFTELFITGWSIEEEKWVNLGNTNVVGTENAGELTSAPFIPNEYEVITFGGEIDRFITEYEIFVFNAISANEDDINAYFRIAGIKEFPNNNLQIFNRWGVKVFEQDGYKEPEPRNGDKIDPDSVFMGISNARATIKQGEKLPTGTYYYVLSYEVENIGVKKTAGYLYLQL